MDDEILKRAFEVLGVPPDVLSGPASLSSAAAIRERLECDPMVRAWERHLLRMRAELDLK